MLKYIRDGRVAVPGGADVRPSITGEIEPVEDLEAGEVPLASDQSGRAAELVPANVRVRGRKEGCGEEFDKKSHSAAHP